MATMDLRHGAPALARLGAGALAALSDREAQALAWLWEFWALPHQLPPSGDWRTWVILGGRGAGKTRAGAEWVRAQVEGARPRDKGRCSRVALVADTLDQAREVMVMGESGILACSPPDRRPRWLATRRMLVWPNGAQAQLFSAHDPESLRGPQFDCAWADELGKWSKAQATWDMLQFGLRLGADPRACVTTTPRDAAALRDLLAAEGTATTHAPTQANRANLAPGFLQEVERRYAGTRQGRQELDGVMLAGAEDALWTPAMIARAQGLVPPAAYDRVVVGVDPAVSGREGRDSTGIVAVGAVTRGQPGDWRAWVIEDATVATGSPDAWGRAVASAARRHGASRVYAEANQGGDLVAHVLRGLDPFLPVESVHARASKGLRAEPVAHLYERGQVGHARGLGLLEDQMARMTRRGWEGRGSPDRLDAAVWALHAALLAPAWREPSARLL